MVASPPTVAGFSRLFAALALPTLALPTLALTSCAQTQWRSGAAPGLATADQMMDVEAADRVRRFQSLARVNGIAPPRIDQVQVPPTAVPGADRPIPVIRIVFDEQTFFSSGSADPSPAAAKVLRVMSENMAHDVPDLRVTLLGHTDAIGSDATNHDLSQRRALDVLQDLVRDGVNPAQLGTVAIGSAQPIAPNATAAGRARNRRVEFLISPSEAANLYVVGHRQVDQALRRTEIAGTGATPAASSAPLYHVAYSGPGDFSEAPIETRRIALSPVRQVPLMEASAAPTPGLRRPDASQSGSPAAPDD